MEFIRPFAFARGMGVAFAKVDLSVTGKAWPFVIESALRAFIVKTWAFVIESALWTFVVETALRAFICITWAFVVETALWTLVAITRTFIVESAFRTLVAITWAFVVKARTFIIETTLRPFVTRCAFGLFFTDGWLHFFNDSRPLFGNILTFNVFCVFKLLGSGRLFLRSRLFFTHIRGVFRIRRTVEIAGPLTDGGFIFTEVLFLGPCVVFAAAAAFATVTAAATLVAVIAISTVAAAALKFSYSISPSAPPSTV